MKITYSKPSFDIKRESATRFGHEKLAFRKQVATYKRLSGAARRRFCILCARNLNGDQFNHRGLMFIVCKKCGHIQLAIVPPKNYLSNHQFHTVYPKLNPKDYTDRKRRIYKPKLNWILNSLHSLGHSNARIKQMSWFEIGTGSGYFLSAVKDFGANQIRGCDRDEQLVKVANRVLQLKAVVRETRMISQLISSYHADIYIAFYVMEHIEDAHEFLLKLRKLAKGTIFVFSVPVFGFATLLDNAFEKNYARNLDGVLHTQLYSDASINYAMEIADYDIKAKWIFGQDIDDLWRYLQLRVADKYSNEVKREIVNKFERIQDELQCCLDRAFFSDQRHILAIKR